MNSGSNKQIRYFLSFIIWCLCIVNAAAQGTGFYTLKNNKFYDPDGNEYYPLILCYRGPEIIVDPINSQHYIGPYAHYGSTGSMECQNALDCLDKIREDFAKIHSMGFNTIRINGTFFNKINDGVPGGQLEADPYSLPILPPYNAGIAQTMFILQGQVLDIAASETLAVILDETSTGVILQHTPNWQSNLQDYVSYISEKAKYFRNYKNVFAYSYIEEPDARNWSKGEICDFSSAIYDASKSQDPNHLITYGGNFYDVLAWDPSIVKVDFYSPHLYPRWFDYYAAQYDVNHIFKEEKIMLRYINKTSPMPWILGETGFKATDDPYWTAQNYDDPPDVYGSITDQGDWAGQSLNWVRDCGGLGYSWWQYQDVFWGSPGEDGLGLLRHGDLPNASLDKRAAGAYSGYLNNNIAPAPNLSLCDEPITDNYYYDPYEQEANDPVPNNPENRTGTVKDAITQAPIENALIVGVTEYQDFNGGISETKLADYYTFSKSDGSFKLFAFHAHTFLTSVPKIRDLYVSCVGCDVWNEGKCNLTPVVSGDKLISTNAVGNNVTVSNETITAFSPRDFRGQLSLTVNDVTVEAGGASDFTARQEININSEFHAKSLSEVHIFTDENCDYFSSYHPYIPDHLRISKNNDGVENQKLIELTFIPLKELITIVPNPSHEIITVIVNKQDFDEMNYQLYDLQGNQIQNGLITIGKTEITLSDLSKGFYLLKFNNSKYSEAKKIIIQ